MFCFFSSCSTAPERKPIVPISPATPKQNTSILYRGTASRSTFHGGPIRDRRQTNNYGPGGVPMHSQDTSAMGTTGRFSIFNKLTSKFSRRYALCQALCLYILFLYVANASKYSDITIYGQKLCFSFTLLP